MSTQEFKSIAVEVSLLIVVVCGKKVDAILCLVHHCDKVLRVLHSLRMIDDPGALFLVFVLLLVTLNLSDNISEHGFAVEYNHACLLEVFGVGYNLTCVLLNYSD